MYFFLYAIFVCLFFCSYMFLYIFVCFLYLFPIFSRAPFLLCAGHTQAIDSFVTESMDTLSNRPETMEEIGAANAKCSQIMSRKSEVRQRRSKIHII